MTLTHSIDEYTRVLAKRRPRTLVAYRASLQRFGDFLAKRHIDLPELSVDHLEDWIASMSDAMKPNSVRSHLQNVKAFLRFEAAHKRADASLVMYRPKGLPRVDRGRSEPVSPEQMTAYAKAARAEGGAVGMVLLLLPVTGMRLSEILQLDTAAVDWEECDDLPSGGFFWFDIKLGRTKTPAGVRRVPLHPAFEGAFRRYVATLAEEETIIFPGRKGRHVTARTVQKRMKEIGAAVGVPDAHPHLMRHQFRYYIGNLGLKDKTVNMLMGHADRTMGQLYDGAFMRELFDAVARVDVSWAQEAIA